MEGEEGSRDGNRGKASWDIGPVIVLVNPTGALELECWSSPELGPEGQDLVLLH